MEVLAEWEIETRKQKDSSRPGSEQHQFSSGKNVHKYQNADLNAIQQETHKLPSQTNTASKNRSINDQKLNAYAFTLEARTDTKKVTSKMAPSKQNSNSS